jgi:phosphoribosylglycinamide formyltransferase-1
MEKGKVAIFLSGRGSNFEAIFRHSQKTSANFQIVLVISDKKKARGLEKAAEYNIPAVHVSPKKFECKSEYEQHIITLLRDHMVELICLAGYMRIVGDDLLKEYAGRILNIHPALLPSFPGLHAQKQALDHGVRISGCTVHFVDIGVDTGPIILQRAVEIVGGDDEDSLSQRILNEEHEIYSEAVQLYFDGRLKMDGRKVRIETK